MSEVHEIAEGIYRISRYGPQAPVEFTQFLIKDESPLLFHTGPKGLFPDTLEAVKGVIDPATLRYVSWSHLESDECGALNEFLGAAPQAEPVHGQIGAMIGINDFFDRPAKTCAWKLHKQWRIGMGMADRLFPARRLAPR